MTDLERGLQRRIAKFRTSKGWLRIQYLWRPNVVVLSHWRSGYQWFRQICWANLERHVVMPPQARYQHFNVERMPPNPRLDRNAILLVRDGRDVLVSLYLSSTRDGPDGTRIRKDGGEPLTFSRYLREEAGQVVDWKGRLLELRNPVDFWSRYNADWLDHRDVVCVVRYEDLLADQATEIRRMKHALGYPETARPPVPLELDFDKHSPEGANLLPGYRRRTAGNWQTAFSAEDLEFFESRAGETQRRLGYADPGGRPAVAGAAASSR